MNQETSKQELLENKPEYNFKTIEELEPAIASLVAQLKEKIETGEYDTLISDEVGGRIPTLVLRKVIQELNPEKRLNTFFVCGGRSSRGKEDYYEMVSFFREHTDKIKKALIVTEFVFRGTTIRDMSDALRDGTDGKAELDVASLFQYIPEEAEELRRGLERKNARLFVGEEDYGRAPGHEEGQIDLHNDAQWLGGIEKSKKEHSIHPIALVKLMQEEGRILRDEEFNEIFGITKEDSPKEVTEKLKDPERNVAYEKRLAEPLTEEEIQKINNDVRKAREDIKTLAEEIRKKIWTEAEE
ncbi:MAG: hypothetical protein WC242_00575 [Candidatus Paceibacterota bacterium]|jgi:hypothetical protein